MIDSVIWLMMNGTERSYAGILENDPDILRWAFEGRIGPLFDDPLRLHLAHRTTYMPDFVCYLQGGIVRLVEVKAGKYVPDEKRKSGKRRWTTWRDDARVKFKIAVEKYPDFEWVEAVKFPDGWEVKKWQNKLKE